MKIDADNYRKIENVYHARNTKEKGKCSSQFCNFENEKVV